MRNSLSARRIVLPLLSGIIGLLTASTPLCAQVILLDNFTARPGGDVKDYNRDLDIRQTGTAAPSGYASVTPGGPYEIQVGGADLNGVTHNSLQFAIFNPYEVACLSNNHNFTEAGGQSITYTVNVRANGPANAGDWHAITFGTTAAKRNTFVNQTDGIGFLLRGNGGYQVFDGANLIASLDSSAAYAGPVAIRIDLSAVSVGPQTVDIYLNGVQIDLAGTGSGSSYTRSAGFTDNYISLMQFYDPGFGGIPVTLIDNFQIAITKPVSTVPTPPTLTATGSIQSVALAFTGSVNATSYTIYRSVTANDPNPATLATGVTGVTYTDSDVNPGVTYFYTVRAVNSVGASAASNEAAATPIAASLVARYAFEDGPNGNGPDGRPKITDVTNSGNDASFEGGGTLNDGFALDPQEETYAGRTDASPFRYIRLPFNFNFGDQFTLFTYAKIYNNFDIQTIFANAGGGNTNGFKLYVNSFQTNDGTIHFEGLNFNLNSAAGTFPLGDNVWHSVAVSANRAAGTAQIYFDGALAASGPTSTNYSVNNYENLLGVFPGGPFITTAEFDDFRIYNGALNAAQIAAIGASGVTVTGRIALEGVSDLTAISSGAVLGTFHVSFRTPNTTTEVFGADVPLTTTGGAFGTYSISGVPAGTYDVAIKGSKNLRVAVASNLMVSGVTSLPDATLSAADADNNNSVDIGDFGILVNAYGGVFDPNVPNAITGYDPAADFDFNGVNDIGDFGLLVNEFSAVGAP